MWKGESVDWRLNGTFNVILEYSCEWEWFDTKELDTGTCIGVKKHTYWHILNYRGQVHLGVITLTWHNSIWFQIKKRVNPIGPKEGWLWVKLYQPFWIQKMDILRNTFLDETPWKYS